MKHSPRCFNSLSYFFDAASFAAVHISEDEIFFIKLMRTKDHALVPDVRLRARMPGDVFSTSGLRSASALLPALSELRKKSKTQKIALVLPSLPEYSTMGAKELKKEVKKYIDVCRQAGFRVRRAEFEEAALARVIPRRLAEGEPALYVRVGKVRSEIFLSSGASMIKISESVFGGASLSHAIASQYDVSTDEAETLKKEKGLTLLMQKGNAMPALLQSASILTRDIDEAIISCHKRTQALSGSSLPVSKIILYGSESSIPGFASYLGNALKLSVSYLNVWNHIVSFDEHVPKIPMKESLDYAEALGGALGELKK